jgi:GAF domain-containing protein
MADELTIDSQLDKEEKYRQLLPQITALLKDEDDLIAKQANFCAALKYGMDFFWVGFYKAVGDELVLGPFQGPVACTRIAKGKGVCGTAWQKKETIIVDDVELFPGHIACSSLSKSEIVVPVFNALRKVALLLDVDATKTNNFDNIDKKYLEQFVRLIYNS